MSNAVTLSPSVCECEGLTVQVGRIIMPLLIEPKRRLALAQSLALPGISQTPRSLQHTFHIKRKQVTQMRQMVLVCDDSCNYFFSSPPPIFFPLSFPLVPQNSHVVHHQWSGHVSRDIWHGSYRCRGLSINSLFDLYTTFKFDVLYNHIK